MHSFAVHRFLVIFRSHHDAVADVHFVDVRGPSPLAAIRKAQTERPPLGEWVTVRAFAWPKGCADVDQAAKKYATRR